MVIHLEMIVFFWSHNMRLDELHAAFKDKIEGLPKSNF